MSRTIFIAAFALGVFVQLEATSGEPGEACAGQECLAAQNDEVTLLQVSRDVAHRTRSSEMSHQVVATQKANASVAKEAASVAKASEAEKAAALARYSAAMAHEAKVEALQELLVLRERPPPDIMLVLLVAIGLSVATAAMYYAGLLMCQSMSSRETAAEVENVLDLSACFAGIIICFCSYGVAQEFIITQLYGDEKFPSVPFLILCNRIFIVAVAIALLIAKGEGIMWKPTLMAVLPGASSMGSSWCQYECLHYVTFPTQVVFKSAKIVPTMIINTIVNFVFAPFSDYLQAVIITLCVIGFSLLTEEASSSDGESNTFKGLVELSIFLLGDALTSNGEKFIYTKYPNFSNTQMMFAMGVVGLIYSSVAVNFEHGGYPFMLGFVQRHPSCLTQILALALCSMAGQYVIYYTVQKHGPVALAIMMTTRQILSIFISAALYGHIIPLSAIALAAVCFAVVLAKPLYKWYSKGSKSKAGP